MKILFNQKNAFSILINDLEYPFVNEGKHLLCEDISVFYEDVNKRDIYLLKENGPKHLFSINDIIDELDKFKDPKIRWRCEDRKNILFKYYSNIYILMNSYKRQERINQIINDDKLMLCLAC